VFNHACDSFFTLKRKVRVTRTPVGWVRSYGMASRGSRKSRYQECAIVARVHISRFALHWELALRGAMDFIREDPPFESPAPQRVTAMA
jgi:hypothetical protein